MKHIFAEGTTIPYPTTLRLTFISQKRRLERLLIARLFWRIAYQIDQAPDTDHAAMALILAGFSEAMEECLIGCDQAERRRLERRLQRLQVEAMRAYEDRTIGLAYFAVVKWLQDLVERDVIAVGEGGPFNLAYDALAVAIEELPENRQLLDDITKSATKNARRLRDFMEAQGLYR